VLLIVGLGNELAGEDACGILIAKEIIKEVKKEDWLRDKLESGELTIKYGINNYFSLIEESIGFDEVIVLDSISSEDLDEGEVVEISLGDNIHQVIPPHPVSLLQGIELMKSLGIFPEEFRIICVNVRRKSFGGRISEEVIRGMEIVKEIVMEEIAYEFGEGNS